MQIPIAQGTDDVSAIDAHLLDLGGLAALELVRASATSALVAGQKAFTPSLIEDLLVELDLATPEACAGLAAADLFADLGQRPTLGAEVARLVLLVDMAAEAHRPSLTTGCDTAIVRYSPSR